MRKFFHNILFYLLSKEIAAKMEAACKAIVCKKESIDAAYIKTLEKEVEYLKDKLVNFTIDVDHGSSYRESVRKDILHAKPGSLLKCNLEIGKYEIVQVKTIVCPEYANLREFILTLVDKSPDNSPTGFVGDVIFLQGASEHWTLGGTGGKLIHSYYKPELKELMDDLSLQGFFTRIGK
jgi:hypothetical protein